MKRAVLLLMLGAACAREERPASSTPTPHATSIKEVTATVIIWGGGTTLAEAEGSLARLEIEKPKLAEAGLKLPEGLPRIDASERYPGLNPGFHIVVLGVCDEAAAADRLLALRRTHPFIYGRTAKASRIECPAFDRAALPRRLLCEDWQRSEPPDAEDHSRDRSFLLDEEAQAASEDGFCMGGEPTAVYAPAPGWLCVELDLEYSGRFDPANEGGPVTGQEERKSLWCRSPQGAKEWFAVTEDRKRTDCGLAFAERLGGRDGCVTERDGMRGRVAFTKGPSPLLCIESREVGPAVDQSSEELRGEAFELAATGSSRIVPWPRACDTALRK